MKKQTLIVATTVLLIGMFLLAACGETQQPPSGTDSTAPNGENQPTEAAPTANPVDTTAQGETKEMGNLSSAVNLNPQIADTPDSFNIAVYIYEGLVRLDQDGKPAPALATSWVISEDGLDYIFDLRREVSFHNGDKLAADIVLANFNRMFDPENPLHAASGYACWIDAFQGYKGELNPDKTPKGIFDGIEKINDLSVLIHINKQDPDLLTKLSKPCFYIVDTNVLTVLGDAYGSNAQGTVGTGPYSVSTWDDQGILLVPFANYWGDKATTNLLFKK